MPILRRVREIENIAVINDYRADSRAVGFDSARVENRLFFSFLPGWQIDLAGRIFLRTYAVCQQYAD
jgi:hypothetical protein